MLDPDLTNILKRRIGASFIDLGIIGLLSTIVWRTQLIAFPITDRDDITGEPLWTAAQQAQRDDIAQRLHTSFVFGDTSYVIDQSGLVLTALCAIVMALMLFVLIPANTGWSPGKRILDLAVIDGEGNNPSLVAHIKRSVVGIVDLLPIFIPGAAGWLAARFDDYHRRFGDRVASTYVIDNRNGAKFIDPSVYQRRAELRRATPGAAAPVTDEMVEIGDRLSSGSSNLHCEEAPELPAPPRSPNEPVSGLPALPDSALPDSALPNSALPNSALPNSALSTPAAPGLAAPAPPVMPSGATPNLPPPPQLPEVDPVGDPVGDPSVPDPAGEALLLPDLPPPATPGFETSVTASQAEPAAPLKAKDLHAGPRSAPTPAEPGDSRSTETETDEFGLGSAAALDPDPGLPMNPSSDRTSPSAELAIHPGQYEPSSAPMPTHRAPAPAQTPAQAAEQEPEVRPEPTASSPAGAATRSSGTKPDWEQPVPEPAPVWQPGTETPDHHAEPVPEPSATADPETSVQAASATAAAATADTDADADADTESVDGSSEMVWNEQWQAWLFWDAEHEHWLRHDLDADRWIPIG